MAQVNYFMTDAETHELVRTVLERYQVHFTPEVHPTASFPRRSTYDALVAAEDGLHFRIRYYISSPVWGEYPYHVKELPHAAHHHFYLMARYGGPYFDHVPSRYHSEGPVSWIVPGMFADYPSYYIEPGSPATVPRPPTMSSAFRDIRRSILKAAVPSHNIEKGFRGPHVTPGAAAFFRAGGWLRIGADHFAPLREGPPNPGMQRTRYARR